MTNSRTANSAKNSIASIAYNTTNILVTFVLQSIFIRSLGAEYNGIKSLFQNLLTLLSVAELGFSTAIVYNLYKPIHDDNREQIKSIIHYYKQIYRLIGIVIFAVGLLVMPFVPLLVGDVSIKYDVRFIFILYLINSTTSYFLSYKAAIFYADQKVRVINLVKIFANLIRNLLQIVILILTNNFVLFLLAQIITTILYDLVIYHFANRDYPYLKKIKQSIKLDIATKGNIQQRVHGLLYHKIGGLVVTSIDNLLIAISKNLGVVFVGFYANYYMIFTSVALIFNDIIASATASIGNLLHSANKNTTKLISVYKNLTLINSWIYCFGTIAIYNLIQPFITLWIGRDYLLPDFVLLILVINFYIDGMKRTNHEFKTAAGIFYIDRFIPIAESIINIVFSLIFMQFFDLAGIFMGTICTSAATIFYSYPKYVYKGIIGDKIINYFKLQAKFLVISLIIFIISTYICSLIALDDVFYTVALRGACCVAVPNALYLIPAFRNPDSKIFFTTIIHKIKTRH